MNNFTAGLIGTTVGYAVAGWLLARVAAQGRSGALLLGITAGATATIGWEPGLLLLTALAGVAASRRFGSATPVDNEVPSILVQLVRWTPGLVLIGFAPLTEWGTGLQLTGVTAMVAATATLSTFTPGRASARHQFPGLSHIAVRSAKGIRSAGLIRALCIALLLTALALRLQLIGPGDPALVLIASVVALAVQECSYEASLSPVLVVVLSVGTAAAVGGALGWLLP